MPTIFNIIYSILGPAPNISGFIAQLVECRTGIREVTGSSPVEVLNFFQASLRNCKNCDHNCEDHSSFDLIFNQSYDFDFKSSISEL